MSRIYDYAPSDKGMARAAIAVTVIVTGLAVFFFMTKSPAAHRSAATGKPNAFAGHFGYLMTYPAGYDVYPQMRGEAELVFFYPRGTKLTADEKQYKALGIIRLEATPRLQINGRAITSDELKQGVAGTLEKNGETFTSKTLPWDKPAFQVDITAPGPIIQVFVEGAKTQYALTGADEKLLHFLAQSIIEIDTPELPAAPGPAAAKGPDGEEESVGKQIDGGFIAYGGLYFPMPKGYTAGSMFARDDEEVEIVYVYPDTMSFPQAQKELYSANSSMIMIDIVPKPRTARKDLLNFAKDLDSSFKRQKWQYTSRWLKNSEIPTLMVEIKNPKHVRIFRFTSKATYKFVAAKWTPGLQSIMAGIREPAK